MKNRGSDVILGLIFFGSLIGLGIVTIVLSDFAIGVERHEVVMYSENVEFLRRGDPVLIHGMASGKVGEITRLFEPLPDYPGGNGTLPKCTVKLVCILDVDPRRYLHTDHRIIIEDRGVLGGKLIRIETGQEAEFILPDQPLIAIASPSVIQAVSSLIDENRVTIKQTINDIGLIAERASSGEGPLGKLLSDDALGQNIEDLITNLNDFATKLARDDHAISRLLANDDVYVKVDSFLNDLNEVSAKIASGEGTMGRLIMEEGTHDDVRALLNDISQGVSDATASLADLRAGEGTIGKLLTDDSLHIQATEFMDDLASLSADLRSGRGTLGKLFNEDELHDNANTMITSITDTVTELREGDGLLARLIDDKELADTLESILNQVLGAIEDARETAPVQSLGSFLFGTF
jgi:phospholipid/cholesterol/gamma-HCH transport system substrate-binding protein